MTDHEILQVIVVIQFITLVMLSLILGVMLKREGVIK